MLKSPIAPLLLAAGCFLLACSVDTGFGGTSFQCTDGRCPDGFDCLAEVCVARTANDAGAIDATDSAPPDAALLSCSEQFGGALQFMLCVEDDTSCEFYVETEVPTACSDICSTYGAECLNAFDATAGLECTRETEDGCDVTHSSQLCVCARSSAP